MTASLLIVDDSKFTRTMLQLPLAKHYQVHAIGDPNEALEHIKENRPDLIISDLKMPTIVEGVGFLRMLAVDYTNIPVLVYTAEANPAETVGDVGLLNMDFIKKPVSPDTLQQKINEALGR